MSSGCSCPQFHADSVAWPVCFCDAAKISRESTRPSRSTITPSLHPPIAMLPSRRGSGLRAIHQLSSVPAPTLSSSVASKYRYIRDARVTCPGSCLPAVTGAECSPHNRKHAKRSALTPINSRLVTQRSSPVTYHLSLAPSLLFPIAPRLLLKSTSNDRPATLCGPGAGRHQRLLLGRRILAHRGPPIPRSPTRRTRRRPRESSRNPAH